MGGGVVLEMQVTVCEREGEREGEDGWVGTQLIDG